MLYIVTGATGHLGNTVVRKLRLEGHEVRAFVLENENTAMLEPLGVKTYFGNVLDKDSIRAVLNLEGTTYTYADVCVIHTAGIISIANRQNKMMNRVNIEGTQNIVDIVKELDIGHFIYISSVHAIEEPFEDTLIYETLTFDESLVVGEYAKTKATATANVVQAMNEGLRTTIIHPSGIIGPYDYGKAHMTQLIEKYLNRKLNARIEGKYDFVDVRDVADAIYTASRKKAYGPFLITGEQIELKKFFSVMQEIAGRKSRAVVFPHWLVKIFVPLFERKAYVRGTTPLFTKYSLYTLTTHSRFSHEKAKAVLNYEPRPLEKTMIDTALWLVNEKRITKKRTLRFILHKFVKP
ncbi:MAG TPA: NAD-dependent epimerase/dehydratase family protein [Bacilli bacterium]|nr:NAD-dependent epimerase/dehydratase family protein [Bacilli bacterium]